MKLFLKYLEKNYSDEKIIEYCQENFICGLLYQLQNKHFKKYNSIFKKEWIKQQYQNQLYLNIYDKIQELCKQQNVEMIPLKGIWLINNIYQNDIAQRKLSDIDIYIPYKQKTQLHKILLSLNFKENLKQLWWGNNFKMEYSKTQNGIELIVEVHTKLFFHIESCDYNILNSIEGKIIHLCGHLALQHNFTKLYWLFDLYYLLSNRKNIDWIRLISIAKTLQLNNSLKLCLTILLQEFQINIPDYVIYYYKLNSSSWYDQYLSKDYLIKNDDHDFKYHLIKFATKDQFQTNFKYYCLWLKHKLF